MKAMQAELEPQSVLVADDDPAVRTVVAESLREAGFRVVEIGWRTAGRAAETRRSERLDARREKQASFFD